MPFPERNVVESPLTHGKGLPAPDARELCLPLVGSAALREVELLRRFGFDLDRPCERYDDLGRGVRVVRQPTAPGDRRPDAR